VQCKILISLAFVAWSWLDGGAILKKANNFEEYFIEKAIKLIESEKLRLDKQVNNELAVLQKELRILTGNKKIDIKNYYGYWAYTALETVARQALMASPQKKSMTNEQITELVKKIGEAEFPIEEMDYWLEVLELEIGLYNAADYIYIDLI